MRNKKLTCGASVVQRGSDFLRGPHGHEHPGRPGEDVVARLISDIKTKAGADIFRPAPAIVDEALVDVVQNQPLPGLPRPVSLSRQANRKRQKMRPKDPVDLQFEVDKDFLPDGKCTFLLTKFYFMV